MECPSLEWDEAPLVLTEEGRVLDTIDQVLPGELELLTARAALSQGTLDGAEEMLRLAAGKLSDASARGILTEQWLQLAKAWERRKDEEGHKTRAETALLAALDISPARAAPALAQFLQRGGRASEAIEQWREAIRLTPEDNAQYLYLARLYEQCGQPDQALSSYMRLIEVSPSARNYLVVSQRLDELAPSLPQPQSTLTVKIALLGNATLDHLRSYVTVECYRAGLRPQVYQCGFDQYSQDILDPESQLYAFSPEVVVCAIHASRLFPTIHRYPFELSPEERRGEMEAGLGELQRLLDRLTDRTSALVLVHNMVAPQHPALGIADLRDELGQAEMFGQINSRLTSMVRTRYQNVHVVDEDRVQARSGKAAATDPRLWLTARMPWNESVLAGLAREYLRYLKPLKALSRKCIVLDLDNTLWGGVIGEDSVNGIKLGADAPGNAFVALQQELERLWRRGVLLAICTKNNEDDVLAVFEQHPDMVLKLSHFAARRINWESKADNIRAIAQELNIGLDSLVFLDDNPVERAHVRAQLPDVLTPELPLDPAGYRAALLELDVFDTLALTDEDRRRNQLYTEQRARRERAAQVESGITTLEEFLTDLQIMAEIELGNELSIPRIAQLTNKTNQFNLTSRRYSEAHIRQLQDAGAQVYSARVCDRFGDNGIVGVAIVVEGPGDRWELDTLLLSCRVMGRGVETGLLAFVAQQARARGIRRLRGWYLPTAKNAPAKDCYRRHAFALIESRADGSELWEFDPLTADIPVPNWLTLRTSRASA